MRALPLFHRIAGQPVIVLGQGEAAEAKRRLVERAGGDRGRRGRCRDARLAFVALDDPEAERGAAPALRAGCWSTSSTGPSCAISPCPACSIAIRCWSRSAPAALRRGSPSTAAAARSGCCRPVSARLREALARRAAPLRRAGPMRPTAAARSMRRCPRRAARSAARSARATVSADGSTGATLRGGDQTIEFTLASDDPDDLTLRQARLLGAPMRCCQRRRRARDPRSRARRCGAHCRCPHSGPFPSGQVVVLRRAVSPGDYNHLTYPRGAPGTARFPGGGSARSAATETSHELPQIDLSSFPTSTR